MPLHSCSSCKLHSGKRFRQGAPRRSQRSRLGLSRQGGRHDRRRRKENITRNLRRMVELCPMKPERGVLEPRLVTPEFGVSWPTQQAQKSRSVGGCDFGRPSRGGRHNDANCRLSGHDADPRCTIKRLGRSAICISMREQFDAQSASSGGSPPFRRRHLAWNSFSSSETSLRSVT